MRSTPPSDSLSTVIFHSRIKLWRWLIVDVLYPLVPALVGGFTLHSVVQWPDSRFGTGLIVVLSGLALILLAVAGSSVARGAIAARYRDLVRAA